MTRRWTTFFAAVVLVASLACGAVPGAEDDPVSSNSTGYLTVEELLEQADQGDGYAQYNLGVSYANGDRVPQDGVQAHKWWDLAASRQTGTEREEAVKSRDQVANLLTPDQRAEAQRLAREWDEAHPRD